QVRHLILVVPAPEQFAVLVRTNKPYDRQEVTRKLAPNAAERRHEGRTYLADGDTALHFAGDQVYYFGNLDGVHRLAAGPGPSGKGGPLDAARKRAGRHLAVAGLNTGADGFRKEMQSLPGAAARFPA